MARSTRTARTAPPADTTPDALAPADAGTDTTADTTTPDTGADTTADDTGADTPPADAGSTDDTTPDAGSTDDTTADDGPDPLSVFGAAWSAAIAERDTTTGSVPAGPSSAVVSAYRALRKSARSDALLSVTTADLGAAMAAGPAAVDGVLLTASGDLAELCRAAGSAPAVPVIDPRETLAALAVATLAAYRAVTGDGPGTDHAADDAAALARMIGTDDAGALALSGWVTTDPAEGDPAGVTRARAALAAGRGRKARGTGTARTAGTGAGKVTGAASKDDGTPYSVAEHAALALADAGRPLKDSEVVKAITAAYPSDARPSPGAVGSIKEASALAAGITRTAVDGRKGWAIV